MGDVYWEAVSDVSGFITPVSSSVRPMMIAILLRDTVNSCVSAASSDFK